jgi:hypothetical protein
MSAMVKEVGTFRSLICGPPQSGGSSAENLPFRIKPILKSTAFATAALHIQFIRTSLNPSSEYVLIVRRLLTWFASRNRSFVCFLDLNTGFLRLVIL